MKKRILSLLLALALAFALLPATSVHATVYSGTHGNLEWSVNTNTGTLMISGTGAMKAESYARDYPWYEYRDSITKLSVLSGVTSIGKSAFSGYTALISADLPNTLTEIGASAFYSCKALQLTALPEGVTTVGDFAFAFCNALNTFRIPASLKTLGTAAFSATLGLTAFSVNSGSTTFAADSNGVLYTKSMSTLIQYPLRRGETSYKTAEGLGGVGAYAFAYSPYLTSVTISSTVGRIEKYAFRNCAKLTQVTLGAQLYQIQASAFFGCSLSSVTFPSRLNEIGEDAFAFCSLKTVTIPASVKKIGASPFVDCGSLEQINVDSANPNYCSVNGVLFDKSKTVLMEYPAGKSGSSYTVPSTVTEIGVRAFTDCGKLTSVSLPSGLKKISESGFWNCTGLKSITLPNGLTTIGKNAFACCSAIKTLKIPDSVVTMNDFAFSGCSALTSVTLPAAPEALRPGLFDDCSSLQSVRIPRGWTTLPEKCFQDCTALTEAHIPNSVTSLYYDAFYNNPDLKIYGVAGSEVETYANKHSIPFVACGPRITTQPKSATAILGNPVIFTVDASGDNLAYQWQYKKSGQAEWTDWTGATSKSLTVRGSSTNNGCQYRCLISNDYAVIPIPSDAATLTVKDSTAKPTITTQPKSATAAIGQTVTFKVVASGTGLKYQWQYKKLGQSAFSNWSGKTSASLPVTASSTNGGCQYRCVVSNSAGSVTSSAATLTVTGSSALPAITTQPSNQSTTLGKSVTFKVVASGSGLSYQWQFSKDNGATWSSWSGKTAATLSVTASATNNGCLYRCVVKNSAGSVNSNSARLTVTDAKPVILVQPKAATVALGKTVTFKVVAWGSGVTYQWQYKKAGETTWHSWSGKTSATLQVTGSATNNGCFYRCVVKNSYGSVNSSEVKLTVT